MLKRIIEKVINIIFFKVSCEKIDECLFGYKLNKNKKIKRILLYFPNHEYMHLGDHLFFEPLAKNLKKINYEVFIYPAKTMKFYFKELNYNLFNEKMNISEFDLIITRGEFRKSIKEFNNVLLYDYINTNLNEKICKDIIVKVFKYLKIYINYNNLNDMPSNLLIKKNNRFKLNENEKYILFNNYLDSGKVLNNFKNYDEIFYKKLLELKNENYKIIHLGTKKEKENDKKNYGLVDIDLRGRTNIEDLFYFASLKNIEVNVGFDAFLMHLFFINNKQNFIYLRNKVYMKREKITKKYLNPPFSKRRKIIYLNNNEN